MADIAITATEVTPIAGSTIYEAIAGEAVVAGETGYLDPADSNKGKKADANAAGVNAHTPTLMFVNNAAAGQPVAYVKAGTKVTIATGADKGAVADRLWQSATPGKICPTADLATGMWPTLIGYLDSTKRALTLILATGPDAIP